MLKNGGAKYIDNPTRKPHLLERTGIKDERGLDIGIARKDIKKYITPDLIELLNIYNISKKWGLPNGKGWLDETQSLINSFVIIEEILEQE